MYGYVCVEKVLKVAVAVLCCAVLVCTCCVSMYLGRHPWAGTQLLVCVLSTMLWRPRPSITFVCAADGSCNVK